MYYCPINQNPATQGRVISSSRTWIGVPARLTILLLITLLLPGCVQQKQRSASYFAIDSLLAQQVRALHAAKASIRKVSLLDNKESKASFTPADTSAWNKELEAFRSLEVINKPVNRGGYTVKDGVPDRKSNLKVKSFTANAELPVAYLRVYYQGTPDNIRKIESKFRDENAMYESTRYLYMEFENIDQKNLLTYFSITGGQKIFLGDTVKYSINAAVSIPN